MKLQFIYTALIVLILCGCSNGPGLGGDDGSGQIPSDTGEFSVFYRSPCAGPGNSLYQWNQHQVDIDVKPDVEDLRGSNEPLRESGWHVKFALNFYYKILKVMKNHRALEEAL